jgi:hypothetical protein
MFALRCAVGLLLMGSGAGCTRAAAPHATHPRSHEPTRTRPPRPECVAKYKNKCFATPDEACAFAGCADQRCEVLQTTPASVSCADMR